MTGVAAAAAAAVRNIDGCQPAMRAFGAIQNIDGRKAADSPAL